MTKILLLAIYLGDSTLNKFKRVLVDDVIKNLEFVRSSLAKLLTSAFDFKEDYAMWLPKNLENLKSGSLDILKDLNPKDFERVRYSTVVSISGPKEHNTFDLNIMAITKHMDRSKRNILEKAVLAYHDTGTVVSLRDFRDIVKMAMNTDIAGKENKNHFTGLPLDQWLKKQEEKKVEEKFNDTTSIHQGY